MVTANCEDKTPVVLIAKAIDSILSGIDYGLVTYFLAQYITALFQ